MMTALDSICVYVEEDGDVTLRKIIHNKEPRPWGLYFKQAEITKGDLKKELLTYGCDPDDIDEAIAAVLQEPQHYTEFIVGKI